MNDEPGTIIAFPDKTFGMAYCVFIFMAYFPIQNAEKILSSKSSGVNVPVISERFC